MVSLFLGLFVGNHIKLNDLSDYLLLMSPVATFLMRLGRIEIFLLRAVSNDLGHHLVLKGSGLFLWGRELDLFHV